uniref:Serine-threonine/tyrosine-protein kinase catalytic domain-containing protein n=1 Tax=Ciona savignyi TaxID=51511 RepID=H2ZG39_CIOSA
MDEAYMMASVECLYLVRLLGVCMAEHVSLITQLMPLGSLLEYVRNPENRDSIRSRQMLILVCPDGKGNEILGRETSRSSGFGCEERDGEDAKPRQDHRLRVGQDAQYEGGDVPC